MSAARVDASWLLAQSLRIGAIVLVGFLLANVLSAFIGAFAIELLYGVKEMLVAVVRYTTLLTALCYAIASGAADPPAAAT